jgi:uncharacterized protein YpmB
LGLIKFIIFSIISVVVLYFAITSIQNYTQKEVEQAQKEADLVKRQLEHEIDQMIKEEEFYFSHGCTKRESETFLCPPNTPTFIYEPESKI